MKKYYEFLRKETNASELIEFLQKNGFSLQPPIDIENILNFLELNYHSNPDFRQIKITGSITVRENEPLIWANPFENKFKERKRFTLAHELGHFMLHVAPQGDFSNFSPFTDKIISFNRDDNWNYKEMEANAFAAQLLMPAHLIENEVKSLIGLQQNMTKEQVVEHLANKFNVSTQAMEFRLIKLGVLL